jgi:hypothetical protein
MGSPISSPQFKGSTENYEAPLSYSKGTSTSLAKSTTWRSPVGAPISSRTLGSTLSWDEPASASLPKSDKGVGRNGD